MRNTVSKLTAWLKQPGNTQAKLAYLLGYETSNVVTQWIKRERIPKHAEWRVLEIIDKDGK